MHAFPGIAPDEGKRTPDVKSGRQMWNRVTFRHGRHAGLVMLEIAYAGVMAYVSGLDRPGGRMDETCRESRRRMMRERSGLGGMARVSEQVNRW